MRAAGSASAALRRQARSGIGKSPYAASAVRWCREFRTSLYRPDTQNVPLARVRVVILSVSVLPQSGIGPLATAGPIPVLR